MHKLLSLRRKHRPMWLGKDAVCDMALSQIARWPRPSVVSSMRPACAYSSLRYLQRCSRGGRGAPCPSTVRHRIDGLFRLFHEIGGIAATARRAAWAEKTLTAVRQRRPGGFLAHGRLCLLTATQWGLSVQTLVEPRTRSDGCYRGTH